MSALTKLINFFNGHITMSPDGTGNIGVDNRTTNGLGDGVRPRNIFAAGLIASGNLYGLNAPYGLNGPASIVGGIIAAANGGAVLNSSIAIMGGSPFLNSTQQIFFAASKDTGSNNVPGFYNNDSVSDYDFYYSVGHRHATRDDIIKFAYSGSLSLMKASNAHLLWTTANSGDIGSPDGGTTLLTPRNIYMGGFVDHAQITKPSNPQAGRNRLYFKSDDVLYGLTSAGVEAPIAGVQGPAASVARNISTFANITGSALLDSGLNISGSALGGYTLTIDDAVPTAANIDTIAIGPWILQYIDDGTGTGVGEFYLTGPSGSSFQCNLTGSTVMGALAEAGVFQSQTFNVTNNSQPGYIQITSAPTASVIPFVLPGTQGAANTILLNDGSGNLLWVPLGTLPTGSNLNGTYIQSTQVAGDATLTGNVTVNGDLVVQGNLVNAGGYSLTVHGNCIIEGVMAFTPDIGVTASDVKVKGNLSTGFTPSNGPATISGTVVSVDPTNARMVIDQSVTGAGFYTKPNIQSGVYVSFTSGALNGQMFQMNGAAGTTIILTAGLPDLSTVNPGDTLSIQNSPAPGPNISFMQPNTGTTPTVSVGGNWECYGFDGSSLATFGRAGCNVVVGGDFVGRYVDRIAHPEQFPFVDLSGDTAYSLLWRGGNSGTLQVDGAIKNMGLLLNGGISNQNGVSAGNAGTLYCNEYIAGDGNYADIIPVVMIGGDCNTTTAGDSAGSGGNVNCRGNWIQDGSSNFSAGGRSGTLSGVTSGTAANGGNFYVGGDFIANSSITLNGGANNAAPADTFAGNAGNMIVIGTVSCENITMDGGSIGDASSTVSAGNGSNGSYFPGDMALDNGTLHAAGGDNAGTGAGGIGGQLEIKGNFSGGGTIFINGGSSTSGDGGNGGTVHVHGSVAAAQFSAGCPGGSTHGGDAGSITVDGDAHFDLYPAATGGPATAGPGGLGGYLTFNSSLNTQAAFVGGGDGFTGGAAAGVMNIAGNLILRSGSYGGISLNGGNTTGPGPGGTCGGGFLTVCGSATLQDNLQLSGGSCETGNGGAGGAATFNGDLCSIGSITLNGGDNTGTSGNGGNSGYITVLGDANIVGFTMNGGSVTNAGSNGDAGSSGAYQGYFGGNIVNNQWISVNFTAKGGDNAGSGLAGTGGTIFVQGLISGLGTYTLSGGNANTGAGGNGGDLDVDGDIQIGDFISAGGSGATAGHGGSLSGMNVYCSQIVVDGGAGGSGSGGAGGTITSLGDLITGAGSYSLVGGAGDSGARGGNISVGGNLIAINTLDLHGGNTSGAGAGGAGGGILVKGITKLEQGVSLDGGNAASGDGGNGGGAGFIGTVYCMGNVQYHSNGGSSAGKAGSAGTATFYGGISGRGSILAFLDGTTGTAATDPGGVFLNGNCNISTLNVGTRTGLVISGQNDGTPAVVKISTLGGRDVLSTIANGDTASIAADLASSIFTYDPNTDAWYKNTGTAL